MNATERSDSFPLCIGHRGAKGYRPENTLSSFEHAITLGCDWIELDVYLHEGELIVIHDDKVDRTTSGQGHLDDYSLEALRSLDAGDGQQIPTLQEVINLVDGRCGINVELKGVGTAEPASALLQTCCERGPWRYGQFLMSSFRHKELALSDPAFHRGALFGRLPDDLWDRAAALNPWSVNFEVTVVTQALVDEAHERGYRVLVYTVNDEADIKRMLNLGVDGMFCDYPDRLLQLK